MNVASRSLSSPPRCNANEKGTLKYIFTLSDLLYDYSKAFNSYNVAVLSRRFYGVVGLLNHTIPVSRTSCQLAKQIFVLKSIFFLAPPTSSD